MARSESGASEVSAEDWVARRRKRFAEILVQNGFEGAVITRPVHIAYFFGLHGWRSEIAAGYVDADGRGTLAVGASADIVGHADQVVRFEDARFATLIDDREAVAVKSLGIVESDGARIGTDLPIDSLSITYLVTTMRRRKDPDEIQTILAAVEATEAGYRAVAEMIKPGVLETEVFGAFHSAASTAAGEGLGALGNDFRGGQPGGRPRAVPLVAGDLIPVDAGVTLRNYNADLCRTFAVSGYRSAKQEQAFRYVEEALLMAEELVRPGASCREVFETVSTWLNGRSLGRFDHHLGHGIGLIAHEAPRINPNWDDAFEEGDVFTIEPGLYADELRAGVRLEQNYAIENGRLRRLSTLPLDL